MPWLATEHGKAGVALLRQLKDACDPDGVLNPGKVYPTA
jgi:FAD/FMN-containing dehydrogenase